MHNKHSNSVPRHTGTKQADSMETQVAHEQIKLLFSNAPAVLGGNTLVCLVTVALFWRTQPHNLLLGWLAATTLISLVRIWPVLRLHQSKYKVITAHYWARLYVIGSACNGIAWGALPWLIYDISSSFNVVALIIITAGIVLSGVAVNASWSISFFAFAIPAVLLLSIRIAMEGGEYIYFALLVTGFLLLSLSVSIKFFRLVKGSIEKGLKNTVLISELKIKQQDAEQANSQKTRFLAAASHDLRQPIHAIELFSDALWQKLNTPEQHHILGKICESVDAMGGLLNSLLDISKLDAGLMKVENRSFNLKPILFRLEEEFSPLAKKKKLRLQMPITLTNSSQYIINSDPILIESIISNLLSNAVKYTETGYIKLGFLKKENVGIISIEDTGIGIAKNEQTKVFDEFYQINNPERDRSKGIGLGLSIVGRSCLLLEHKFEMVSALNHGSRFEITVPLASKSALTDIIPTPSSYDKLNITVLVIDDEKQNLDAMKAMLTPWGCNVLQAQSESEALALATSNIDMLIADYRLRDGKLGSNAIHTVRCTLNSPDLPAIIISGDTEPKRMQEMNNKGFKMLHKPVKAVQMRTLMQHVLLQEKKT